MTTRPTQPCLAVGDTRPLHGERVHVEDRLHHRDVEELDLTGACSREQRRRDRAERHHPGTDIAERHASAKRRSVGFAGERRNTCVGLCDQVEARQVGL